MNRHESYRPQGPQEVEDFFPNDFERKCEQKMNDPHIAKSFATVELPHLEARCRSYIFAEEYGRSAVQRY